MRADSITGNKAGLSGGRKKYNGNLIEIWYDCGILLAIQIKILREKQHG